MNNLLSKIKTIQDFLSSDIQPLPRLYTGTNMDNVAPLTKGSIHVFSAPTGHGKSMCLLHLATVYAAQGYRVLYVSMENTENDDKERLEFSVLPKYPNISLTNATFDIIHELDPDANEILDMCKSGDYDVFIIDGIECMFGAKDGMELYNQIGLFLQAMRKLLIANSKQPALLVNWQLNRSAYSLTIDKLDTSSLSGSMRASHLASSVWAIVQQEVNGLKTWMLRCIKCRYDSVFSHDTILVGETVTTPEGYQKLEFNLNAIDSVDKYMKS